MKKIAFLSLGLLPFLAIGCQESSEVDADLSASALEQQIEQSNAQPADKADEAQPADKADEAQPGGTPEAVQSNGVYGLLDGGNTPYPWGAVIYLNDAGIACSDRQTLNSLMLGERIYVQLSRFENGTFEIVNKDSAYGCENDGPLEAIIIYRKKDGDKRYRAKSGTLTVSGIEHFTDTDWLEQRSITVTFDTSIDKDGSPMRLNKTITVVPCQAARVGTPLYCPDNR